MKNYTGGEKQEIRKLMHITKNTVMYRKYLVIHLHMKGLTNTQIAEIVDLDYHTVGIYIKKYNSSGIEGLTPKLNLIEGLWGWLKDTCINNEFFDKFYKIKIAIRKFVTLTNFTTDVTIDRLCIQL